MKYIELTIHTTTEASEIISDIMWNYTDYGVTICDRADIIALQTAKESTFDRCLLGGFCCLVFLTILTLLTVLSYIRNIVIIVHIVNGFQPYLPAVGASAPAESYTTLVFQFLHLGVQPPG